MGKVVYFDPADDPGAAAPQQPQPAAPAPVQAPAPRITYFDPADAPAAAAQPAAPPPVEPVDDVTRAQKNKAAMNQVQTVGNTARNLKAALQGIVAAQTSRDEQEIGKANANWQQALGDLRRLNHGGSSAPVVDPNETPVIGNGSGLRQVGNFMGSFFVPFRQLVAEMGKPSSPSAPKTGFDQSQTVPGEDWDRIKEWAGRSREQIIHPSIRQNMGDVMGDIWKQRGEVKPVSITTPSDVWQRTYDAALKQAMESGPAPSSFNLGGEPKDYPSAAQVQQAIAVANSARETERARPQIENQPVLGGVSMKQAQVASEIVEMLAPTPGGMALGAATKYGIGVPAKWAGRGLAKLADKTQGGQRLLDFASPDGPLRRLPAALAGQPELPEWINAADELLESNVAAGQKQHAMAQRLRDALTGLSPAEKTLVFDSVEHPELLSGNPRLLDPLAARGNVDSTLTRLLNPKAPDLAAFPNVSAAIEREAARAGLPLAMPNRAIGSPVGNDVLRAWLGELGAQRPDIKKLWPARQTFLSLQDATRAERLAVDPAAANISEPYLRHVSTPAAEQAMRSKGLPVQATDPQILAGNVARSQGQRPVAGLKVIPEKSRHLQEDITQSLIDGDQSILPPQDTRLDLGGAMAQIHPELGARDFFSGAVAPQAEKFAKDIRETEVMRLLRQWAGRGKDVTGQLPDAMSAAPGGVGNWQVPQSQAWTRATDGKQIALPIPVAQTIDQQSGAGRGFYDTLMDIGTGRAPAATRTPGSLYSPLSELFKIPATVMNPRYYIRNWGSNWDQLYKEFGAAGAPFSPTWWRDRELRKTLLRGQYGAGDELATPLAAGNGNSATLGELRDAMTKRGMLGETNNAKVPIGPRIEQELADLDLPNPKRTALLRSLNPLRPSVNPIVQRSAELFGRGPEEAARAQSTIRGFLNGGDVGDAVRRTEDLLFNPNRTSEAMNRVSGLFPFIRWWGKNVPLQAQQFINHPERVYNVSERIPDLSRRLMLSPDEYQQSKSRPVGQYLADSPLYWTGLHDKVNQPVVMPYPFSTESELYDTAKAALSVPRDIAQKNIPDFPLTRSALWDALMSRANPMAQYAGEPNRDILRGTAINTEIRDPNGELIGYQEGTGKAGAMSELMHRAAERMGWPRGKQLPILATSHDPGSPFVFQDSSNKRALEQIPVLSAFPLSMLRMLSQNSQLTMPERSLMPLGMSLQSVPWYQAEANRPYQTREQIEQQKKTSRQKGQ